MALLVISSSILPHLLLGFFLLVVNPIATTAKSLHEICPDSGTDYSTNSPFQSNLNSLFTSLAANGPATGFLNDTAGHAPDQVYGLILCRGDVEEGKCRSCVTTAEEEILQACPYKRSAVIWYDNCMLRYSNQWFFSLPLTNLSFGMRNQKNLTEVTQFLEQLDPLMKRLVRYAAYNGSARMFATGVADYGDPANPKIYGLVQCTRDLTPDDCNTCLTGIVARIPTLYLWRRGARTVKATCNFRYELYSFYSSPVMVSVPLPPNATWFHPPAAAPQPLPTAPATEGKKKKKKNRTSTILAIAISFGAAFVFILVLCVRLRRSRAKRRRLHSQEITAVESLLFDLSTLRVATGNFSDQNMVGQGGFGSVYKGLLPDGRQIAVKRLSVGSTQGVGELKNEVVLLAKLQHRSLVRLLGVCLEGEEKLLVYGYAPNGSLDTFLFDPTRSEQLTWETRYKIIGGIARGLQYLHEESQLKIIHRDLKASNILLDEVMNPKIADFGLARLFDSDQTQERTRQVVGTYGYMAPEYAKSGQFSNKTDVFSFGVLVLEVVTGHQNSDFSTSGSSTDLLSYVWEKWRNGNVQEIIDPSLGGQYQGSELMRCVQIGLACVQEAPADRPTMSSVVLMLSSHSVSLQVPSRPAVWGGHSQPADLDALSSNHDSSTSTTCLSPQTRCRLQT